MTPAELATIEALANAATPGQWVVEHWDDQGRIHRPGSADTVASNGGTGDWDDVDGPNAAFIASARAAVPALVAEVRRLQDLLITRDMQLSTVKELLAQAEAKSDELRGRWDRAETALESSRALHEQTRKIATQRVELARVDITAPVRHLLTVLESAILDLPFEAQTELDLAMLAVRTKLG